MLPARKLENVSAEYLYEQSTPKAKPSSRRRKKRLKLPETLAVCLVAAMIVGVGAAYLGLRVQTMRLDLKLRQVERKMAETQQENEELRLKLNELQSLAVIEQTARLKLGMSEPEETAVVVIQPDSQPEEQRLGGWLAEGQSDRVFQVVANWINRWLPLGGVEAGQLGH